jgi:hypothetical protein
MAEQFNGFVCSYAACHTEDDLLVDQASHINYTSPPVPKSSQLIIPACIHLSPLFNGKSPVLATKK